jgi:glycyl-tRNA synthetase beta chain
MTYQRPDGSDQKFVRPAHRLVALHGADVVPVRALGLDADRITEGHRFQGQRTLTLASADEYAARLAADGKEITGFDARRGTNESALQGAAAALGADLAPDAAYAALLDEVTALTENPAVYTGRFDEEFLEVPQECLILTMRTNQKYFPLFDRSGKLRREFLVVSNMRLDDPSRIVSGNERVIRPRLADAKFFFDQDRKTKLVDRLGRLANVVYHNKLGSQIQRIERMQILSGQIAKLIGADPAASTHAAALAKADLVTDMVGEFPELQGTMGRYYALHDGEPAAVADAIEQHYRPKFAGDALPEGPIAIAVALADKIDTLVGIYGIGLVPTGDKDAYGLRRHAVGVLRILIERGLAVDLPAVLRMAESHFFHDLLSKTTVDDLFGFILERLRGMLREQGYTANEIEAVLVSRPARIDQVPARLAAVREFGALPEADALAAANKRIQNILKKADAVGDLVNEQLFAESAERDLWNALAAAEPVVESELAAARYTAALKSLAALRGAVDAFFDKVLVNADDLQLRANRLALLARLGRLMNRVADISKLAG